MGIREAGIKKFTGFIYREKGGYDQYLSSVLKVLRTFLRYLELERGFPALGIHLKMWVPSEVLTPVVLIPEQLKFLINDHCFYASLRAYSYYHFIVAGGEEKYGPAYFGPCPRQPGDLQVCEAGSGLPGQASKGGAHEVGGVDL